MTGFWAEKRGMLGKGRFCALAGLTAGILVCSGLRAGTITWDAEDYLTNRNWSNSTNWNPNQVPGTGDTALFDLTATGPTYGYNVVDQNFTVQKLTYGAPGATTTVHTTTIPSGVTLLVTGDTDGSLDKADFNIAHDLSNYSGAKSVTVTFSGAGTLRVGQSGTSTADIVIGRRGSSGGGTISASVDMSGLSTFVAEVDEILVGRPGNSPADVSVTWRLASGNTVKANTLTLSHSYGHGSSYTNVIRLGQQNTLQVDTIYIGRQKTSATLQFDTGLTNPTVSIANRAGTGGANLYVGYNDASGTGTNPTGLVDFTAGSVSASFGTVVLGHIDGGGGSGTGEFRMAAGNVTATELKLGVTSGSPSNPANTQGKLILTGGTFTVNGNVTNGGGTATIQLKSNTLTGATFTVNGNIVDSSGATNLYVDGGTMTVTGGVGADNLRVGYNGLNAQATFSGGAVQIGSGASGHNLYVGYRDSDTPTGNYVFQGTLNLAGATSVTINVNTLGIGYSSGGSGEVAPQGTLILSPNNTITATTIRLAYSENVGLKGQTNRLSFGLNNTVSADTVIFGGSKGVGVVDIVSGGTLTLQGKTGQRANLYIGYQPVFTAAANTGTVDLTGTTPVTFNAMLDRLWIGWKVSAATGATSGTLKFEAGNIDVNEILLGTRGGGGGTATGTLVMNGGTLTAGSIAQGDGTGVFQFNAGTLHVGTFGTASRSFDLVQGDGAGALAVLAPGNSIGSTTIYGNYTQASDGVLEIELASPTSYDRVTVTGRAVLGGSVEILLLDGYQPATGQTFNVVTASSGIQDLGIQLQWDPGSLLPAQYWIYRIVSGQGAEQILQLQVAVPEPASWLLALLAGLAGLGYAGRKRSRPAP